MQQEKTKLNCDGARNKQIYQKYQDEFDEITKKYETAMKEKMLIKLEKERLSAKVDSLESSLKQMGEENEGSKGFGDAKSSVAASPKKKAAAATFKMTNVPSVIPKLDRPNPYANEEFEPTGSHLSC